MVTLMTYVEKGSHSEGQKEEGHCLELVTNGQGRKFEPCVEPRIPVTK